MFCLTYFGKFLCLGNVRYNGFFRESFLISPARGKVVEVRKEGSGWSSKKRRHGERRKGKEGKQGARDELGNRKEKRRGRKAKNNVCRYMYLNIVSIRTC